MAKRGRRPGYRHSEETKQKISESKTEYGQPPEHTANIVDAKREKKCRARFEELKKEYPEHEEFFEKNKPELLIGMRDVRTEKELRDIKRRLEGAQLHNSLPYSYSSSSYHAVEDTVIGIVDFKLSLI